MFPNNRLSIISAVLTIVISLVVQGLLNKVSLRHFYMDIEV